MAAGEALLSLPTPSCVHLACLPVPGPREGPGQRDSTTNVKLTWKSRLTARKPSLIFTSTNNGSISKHF